MNKNTTVKELIDSGRYGEFAQDFWTYITEDHLNAPLSNYGYEACDFEHALKRCQELAGDDSIVTCRYQIYSLQEIYEAHDKKEAYLYHFPPKNESSKSDSSKKPFALVIPGGGFARQWALIEGFAIAARLNDLGMPAFVLIYRTAQKGVLKKAMEDMHRGLDFILENADQFNVSKTSYILGGFSAGATLAATMATENLGWKKNNLPKSDLIFLGYPAQRMDMFYDSWNSAPYGSEQRASMQAFLDRLLENEITPDALAPFITENHINKETCPPLFITANEDDPVVPFINSLSLYESAKRLGIPVSTAFGKKGGHSYGYGNNLEVEGWLEKMIEFWKSQKT